MNILKIENKLNVVYETVNVAAYDFDFELFFQCSHPSYYERLEQCIARIGGILDYESTFNKYLSLGLKLVNSPAEHKLASELEHWYPIITEFTPKSICTDAFPAVEEIEKIFDWPVFIKGSRQTSKHNPEISIARNADHYQNLIGLYQSDPILHWQKIAIRKFVALQPIAGYVPSKISPSLEFRTFWWHGKCVGWGHYWYQLTKYTAADIDNGLGVAKVAVDRLNVPFIVVDIAKTIGGQWIIIECNDAQESGHVGIQPNILWQNILAEL
jgi:ATP-grasp domain, R2K clade family 3